MYLEECRSVHTLAIEYGGCHRPFTLGDESINEMVDWMFNVAVDHEVISRRITRNGMSKKVHRLLKGG
jgi:hypothetical protein